LPRGPQGIGDAYTSPAGRLPRPFPSPHQGSAMLKFFASAVGIIFLIGLLVVIGLLMLIF
jgi:hypothetical protein